MPDADAATLDAYADRLDPDDRPRCSAHHPLAGVAARRVLGRAPEGPGAARADHLITVSPQNRDTAIAVLGIAPDDVTALPNGVDIERFHPRARDRGRVAAPRSVASSSTTRRAGRETGPARERWRYTEADLDRLLGPDDDATVLLLRRSLPRLQAGARPGARVRARPAELIARPARSSSGVAIPASGRVSTRSRWPRRSVPTASSSPAGAATTTCPRGSPRATSSSSPRSTDPYPQVPLEAMAVGLPVLACGSGGLISMVNLDPHRPTGWFVPPDDARRDDRGAGHGGQRPGRDATPRARTRSRTPGPSSRGTDWCRASRRCTPRRIATGPRAGARRRNG